MKTHNNNQCSNDGLNTANTIDYETITEQSKACLEFDRLTFRLPISMDKWSYHSLRIEQVKRRMHEDLKLL